MEITCYMTRVVILQLQLLCFLEAQHFCGADPTHGFTRVQLTEHDRSPTGPRTEIRNSGHGYTSGVRQFEGHFLMPQRSSGVTIMQIFGAAHQATTLQLRVCNGDLKYYIHNVVAANIYNKWFRLNVIHNVGARKVTIFIDGEKKFVVKDHSRATFYFKYGVYAAPSESRWRGIKLFKK
ncbi:hypothetical protein PRUPE_8G033300 [Prunus persica]|uniref:Alginate lyase 2 domain-containing protein n=1 Tax=Prunus persica TaxID=3760 RepID=A0A251MS94_PRUPE|nr:hypothetical protein PRUPE_8G033300 [Prunus persica]